MSCCVAVEADKTTKLDNKSYLSTKTPQRDFAKAHGEHRISDSQKTKLQLQSQIYTTGVRTLFGPAGSPEMRAGKP